MAAAVRMTMAVAAEVRVVTECRGDAEPPQRRDEVERRFQPEPGQ
jgi:hypothetical protein